MDIKVLARKSLPGSIQPEDFHCLEINQSMVFLKHLLILCWNDFAHDRLNDLKKKVQIQTDLDGCVPVCKNVKIMQKLSCQLLVNDANGGYGE